MFVFKIPCRRARASKGILHTIFLSALIWLVWQFLYRERSLIVDGLCLFHACAIWLLLFRSFNNYHVNWVLLVCKKPLLAARPSWRRWGIFYTNFTTTTVTLTMNCTYFLICPCRHVIRKVFCLSFIRETVLPCYTLHIPFSARFDMTI